MDLLQELMDKIRDLDTCIKLLREHGSNLAQAEHDYKIRLRAECLALRDEGMPVTLIQLTAYGIPAVAKLRHERDVAQVVYDANKDAVNAIKLEIRVIQQQIALEMGAPSNGFGGA